MPYGQCGDRPAVTYPTAQQGQTKSYCLVTAARAYMSGFVGPYLVRFEPANSRVRIPRSINRRPSHTFKKTYTLHTLGKTREGVILRGTRRNAVQIVAKLTERIGTAFPLTKCLRTHCEPFSGQKCSILHIQTDFSGGLTPRHPH